MELYPDIACVRIRTIIVGLSTKHDEPFYFVDGKGPYFFDFSYKDIQKIMLEEMLPQHMTEERHALPSKL